MTHEDVISWLEYLSDDARSKADGLVPTNIEIACGMAIDALKAQEPMVFDVGDFFGEEFGWLEYRTYRPGFSNFEPCSVLISDIDEENVTVIFKSTSVQKLPLDRINKNWRIWSNYPTHELLRAVKWDG